MVGLSLPQAAATLAVTFVGLELGLFGPAMVNAVIALILVSCLVGAGLVERAGRAHVLARPVHDRDLGAPHRILVPVANPATAERLLDVAFLVRDPEVGRGRLPDLGRPRRGRRGGAGRRRGAGARARGRVRRRGRRPGRPAHPGRDQPGGGDRAVRPRAAHHGRHPRLARREQRPARDLRRHHRPGARPQRRPGPRVSARPPDRDHPRGLPGAAARDRLQPGVLRRRRDPQAAAGGARRAGDRARGSDRRDAPQAAVRRGARRGRARLRVLGRVGGRRPDPAGARDVRGPGRSGRRAPRHRGVVAGARPAAGAARAVGHQLRRRRPLRDGARRHPGRRRPSRRSGRSPGPGARPARPRRP